MLKEFSSSWNEFFFYTVLDRNLGCHVQHLVDAVVTLVRWEISGLILSSFKTSLAQWFRWNFTTICGSRAKCTPLLRTYVSSCKWIWRYWVIQKPPGIIIFKLKPTKDSIIHVDGRRWEILPDINPMLFFYIPFWKWYWRKCKRH